jgi:hypothetical protein
VGATLGNVRLARHFRCKENSLSIQKEGKANIRETNVRKMRNYYAKLHSLRALFCEKPLVQFRLVHFLVTRAKFRQRFSNI